MVYHFTDIVAKDMVFSCPVLTDSYCFDCDFSDSHNIRASLKILFKQRRAEHTACCVKPPRKAYGLARRFSLQPTRSTRFCFSNRFSEEPISV
ncbi:MAG TPA: hypothetical protein DDX91_05020 [Ruminococcaceae bacterium]|nr:hypothetical protein [Oscillospiraceae bacterium]